MNLPNYIYYVKAHHQQLPIAAWETLIKDPVVIKEANKIAEFEDRESTDIEDSNDSEDNFSDVR